MANDKSQTRIHRFTIAIIIVVTLIVIGGNIANIDAVEFNEAFGTSLGETEDNGFEPEPLDAELSQQTKDIYTLFFTEKKQTLYGKMANIIVIYEPLNTTGER